MTENIVIDIDEEWRNSPVAKKMDEHIDERGMFMRVCEESCVVNDDEINELWLTWCIRNREVADMKSI